MIASPTAKITILFLVIVGVIATSFAFAIWHHDDGDTRVRFELTSHTGDSVTQADFGGQHLMVFFGFTSCHSICPTQMSKLTQVMAELDESGHGSRITPVFISVDTYRDSPEKVASYLEHFDYRFVGLTGSRPALQSAADSFKTPLEDMPIEYDGDYQITHSSVVYIVDPFSRIVDYISGAADRREMARIIRDII